MTDWSRLWDVAEEAIRDHSAMQTHFELSRALRIASDAGVDTVLEIGSSRGGTLHAWRQVASTVMALTLPDDETYGQPPPDNSVGYFDSHTKAAHEWLRTQLNGSPLDLLFIDGDHTLKGCAADYLNYRSYVRPGGLIMIHDIVFEPGVIEFWNELDADKHEIINPFGTAFGIGFVKR